VNFLQSVVAPLLQCCGAQHTAHLLQLLVSNNKGGEAATPGPAAAAHEEGFSGAAMTKHKMAF
jgi:hypothetical protein